MTKYIVSDTHIDDQNAIEKYMRPFNDVDHMNETIIQNWNKLVSYNDEVIILGDFIHKNTKEQRTRNILSLLNGNKHIVNNKNGISVNRNKSVFGTGKYKIQMENYSFYMTHDINNVPKEWDGWVIHGKSHNLHIKSYPKYNYNDRNVNVSCEMTGYTPIMIKNIVNTIKEI